MKGIVLAGGAGSRLYPLTMAVSKQLLPVYDKPMIYYPIATLFLAGIREIAIISTPRDLPAYEILLGNGEDFGVQFHYVEQTSPRGLAEAFLLCNDFIHGSSVALALGDNILHGARLSSLLRRAVRMVENKGGAGIFGHAVRNPSDYGVMELDSHKKVLSIEEKPVKPRSPWAVIGLYFYDASVTQKARRVEPSARGELEITTINQMYLLEGALTAHFLGRGFAWLDSGTQESLADATNFIRVVEERQGTKVACLEEIAFRSGWIGAEKLLARAKKHKGTVYGAYLESILSQIPGTESL
ncbi:MAG: glucose-1-phosphate thymidylyltransferase RfbA [Spirochaetales bacterium]|nr:glucose-1-phosphate thymidylyltransferase RfbA [Spirochaetales bacterium]